MSTTSPLYHNKILRAGFQFPPHKVRHGLIGFNLLPKKFALYEIQKWYEAIRETEMDEPNFRRKLLNMNLLVR